MSYGKWKHTEGRGDRADRRCGNRSLMGSRHVDNAVNDGRHDGRWNDGRRNDGWLRDLRHRPALISGDISYPGCRAASYQNVINAIVSTKVLEGSAAISIVGRNDISLLRVLIVTPGDLLFTAHG